LREISNIKYQISKCLKHFRFYIVILIFTFYILILPPTPVYAANPCTPDPKGGFNIGSCFGFGDITSLGQATSRLVIPVFSIAAAAVVIYFLLGAFKYLSSSRSRSPRNDYSCHYWIFNINVCLFDITILNIKLIRDYQFSTILKLEIKNADREYESLYFLPREFYT